MLEEEGGFLEKRFENDSRKLEEFSLSKPGPRGDDRVAFERLNATPRRERILIGRAIQIRNVIESAWVSGSIWAICRENPSVRSQNVGGNFDNPS